MVDLWGNFSSGIIDYAMSAYSSLEPWVYPFILIGIIGYVYAVMNSITVAIVAIIFTLGIYATTTSIWISAPVNDAVMFLYLVSVIGIGLLIAMLFIKRRD